MKRLLYKVMMFADICSNLLGQRLLKNIRRFNNTNAFGFRHFKIFCVGQLIIIGRR